MRSRMPAQTEAGSGRHLIDWALQTEGGGSPHGLVLGCPRRPSFSPAGSEQTFRRSSPPAPRPPPSRPLPRCPARFSAALRTARLAPAARIPPRPPIQGRDHGAQTAGPSAPSGARSPASRRARRALIGLTARPPSGTAQSEPRTPARLLEGRGRGGRWLCRGTSPCGWTGLVTPPSTRGRLSGVPRNPSTPRPGPLSWTWRVRLLPP